MTRGFFKDGILMCMHIFCPGREIHIDYAAEAVTLIGGGSEDRLDILVTNHSADPVDRIHIVYPHPLPLKWKKFVDRGGLFDATDTWLIQTSPLNRYFKPKELQTTKVEGTTVREGTTVSVVNDVVLEVPDPGDIARRVRYEGQIVGSQRITPYQVDDDA